MTKLSLYRCDGHCGEDKGLRYRCFLSAALPRTCLGLLLAIFRVQNSAKKKIKEKRETYSIEGIALGMCFGVAAGTTLGNIGIGLTPGMLSGLVVKSVIGKKGSNDRQND